METADLVKKYRRVGGTLMFKSDRITVRELNDYMKEFVKEFPDFVFYAVRSVPKNSSKGPRLHLDFLYLVEKEAAPVKGKGLYAWLIEDNLLDKLYRKYGNVLQGYDVNSGDIEELYLNNNFFQAK